MSRRKTETPLQIVLGIVLRESPADAENILQTARVVLDHRLAVVPVGRRSTPRPMDATAAIGRAAEQLAAGTPAPAGATDKPPRRKPGPKPKVPAAAGQTGPVGVVGSGSERGTRRRRPAVEPAAASEAIPPGTPLDQIDQVAGDGDGDEA